MPLISAMTDSTAKKGRNIYIWTDEGTEKEDFWAATKAKAKEQLLQGLQRWISLNPSPRNKTTELVKHNNTQLHALLNPTYNHAVLHIVSTSTPCLHGIPYNKVCQLHEPAAQYLNILQKVSINLSLCPVFTWKRSG